MKKLAIVTTHPIQYYAPVFSLLQKRGRIAIKVFYTWGEISQNKYDPGFDKTIRWDIPLLEDYPYEWVKNTAKDPGTHHFNGINNPELANQITAWQPDAILVYGWGFRGHLNVMRHFKNKIPVLFRGDSTLLDQKRGLKTLLRYAYLNRVYSNVDGALYVGTNSKAYFKRHGLKENQLHFAPHAIDNERFGADRKLEALELRRELNISDDETLVLFTGKFEEKKAPELLLDAFLSLNNSNAHLLFVGNGSLETKLKSKATYDTNVHFLPFQNQSQIPVVYQACDIFCIPSKGPNETWGMAVNEAMVCGNAVLSSDKVGAAIDLVKPGQNGFIFKSGNLADLILKLKQLLLSGKHNLAKMGQRSKGIIQDWSLENQAIAIEQVINND